LPVGRRGGETINRVCVGVWAAEALKDG